MREGDEIIFSKSCDEAQNYAMAVEQWIRPSGDDEEVVIICFCIWMDSDISKWYK